MYKFLIRYFSLLLEEAVLYEFRGDQVFSINAAVASIRYGKSAQSLNKLLSLISNQVKIDENIQAFVDYINKHIEMVRIFIFQKNV